MPHRPALSVCILLVALALLAPLASVADACPDCGSQQGCCATQGCPCCVALTSVLPVMPEVAVGLGWVGFALSPEADRCPAGDPHAVFHVPKSPLA